MYTRRCSAKHGVRMNQGLSRSKFAFNRLRFLFLLLQVARIDSTEQRQSISAKTLSLYVSDPFHPPPRHMHLRYIYRKSLSSPERERYQNGRRTTRKLHGLHVNWLRTASSVLVWPLLMPACSPVRGMLLKALLRRIRARRCPRIVQIMCGTSCEPLLTYPKAKA